MTTVAKDSPSGLRFWDPRKALEYPPIYNFFQNALGADKSRRRFIEEHIAPLGSGRVLEVGCGPGTNCAWMPQGIQYVGCDVSESYIAYAKQQYGDRAEFFAAPVGQLAGLGLKPFNAVFACALLHHLTDDQVLTLCDEVIPLLGPGGTFMTCDPCFDSGNSRLSHFVASCDRGRYVRYPDQYQALLARRFSVIERQIGHGKLLVIPASGVLFRAVGVALPKIKLAQSAGGTP